jgi:hypothetical protein
MALFTMMSASMSYAVINVVYEESFRKEDYDAKLQETFRIISMVSMCLYHLGMFHFYQLILSLLTRDQHERFMFAMEHYVEQFNKMTLDDFMDFIETNKNGEASKLGLMPYSGLMEERKTLLADSDDEEVIIMDQNLVVISKKNTEQAASRDTSCWSRLFSTSKPVNDEESAPILVVNTKPHRLVSQ